MAYRDRSIAAPITVTSLAVVLVLALVVAWTLIWTSAQWVGTWLLLLGILSLAMITAVIIIFGASLALRIVELRRQNRFIDSVTHELKSPLASLQLCLETLGRSDVSPVQQRELQSMMAGDVQRLSDFIDDVVAANRVPHAGPGRATREISLDELVDLVCEKKKVIYDGDVDLRVDLPAGLALTTEPFLFEMIIRNLIDNAIKYSKAPATVEVSAMVDTANVVITVEDYGVGIQPDEMRKVMRRFYRSEREAIRGKRGTGLGLYVASHAARQLGGRLHLVSEGVGHGTRAKLTLPRTIFRRREGLQADALSAGEQHG